MGVNIGTKPDVSSPPKTFTPPGTVKPSKPVATGPVPLPPVTAAALNAAPPITPDKKLAEIQALGEKAKTLQKQLAAVAAKPAVAATMPVKSELSALVGQIVKDKGDKIIYRGRDVPDVKRLPTGDFEFDFSTGGGFPRGRFSLIYGPESSCKTTLALRAAAIAQRGPEDCNKAVFIDVEHSFDADRAEEVGVDVDALIVVKPGYGEVAADLTIAMVYAADVAVVIYDSIAATISTAEVDKSLEKFDVGTSAILIKRMTNKINIALAQEAKRDHFPAVILINQIRYKVGVVFGNPETTPGGKNPHFLSALTIRVTGKNKIVGAVNPDKPSFKELDCNIIKAKVGIIRSHFEMDMAMIANGDLLAGETASFGLVKNELQAAGLLVKGPKDKGWVLDGKTYATQVVIEDTYYAEIDFALHLQQLVIQSYSGKKTVFDNTKAYIAANDGDKPESAPGGMMFQDKEKA
jgi:recombination protein RecA